MKYLSTYILNTETIPPLMVNDTLRNHRIVNVWKLILKFWRFIKILYLKKLFNRQLVVKKYNLVLEEYKNSHPSRYLCYLDVFPEAQWFDGKDCLEWA